jgi:hypothetical protein
LVESLGIRVAEIEAQPKRVKAALAADLQQATQDSQKLEAILQSYKVVPHSSGKDAYYDAYVQIDQTQPAWAGAGTYCLTSVCLYSMNLKPQFLMLICCFLCLFSCVEQMPTSKKKCTFVTQY